VLAAAAAKQRTGATAAIGFAVAPEVDPAGSTFWPAVAKLGGPQFAAALNYVGLDMYPDVFGPSLRLDQLDSAVGWLLGSFRQQVLPIAGSGPAVPIRVCENGWPTGPGRSPARQADVLETVVRALHARRAPSTAAPATGSAGERLPHRGCGAPCCQAAEVLMSGWPATTIPSPSPAPTLASPTCCFAACRTARGALVCLDMRTLSQPAATARTPSCFWHPLRHPTRSFSLMGGHQDF
jgi:hypothetical protein